MKFITFALAITLILASPVKAEIFQFVDSKSNSYLVYWSVWKSNKFLGYTDGRGRLRIERPKGTFSIKLKYRGKSEKIVQITVTSTRKVELIKVQ